MFYFDFFKILQSNVECTQIALNKAKRQLVFFYYLVNYIKVSKVEAYKIVHNENYDSFFNSTQYTEKQKEEMMDVFENYNNLIDGLRNIL